MELQLSDTIVDGVPTLVARGRIRVADVEVWTQRLEALGRRATTLAYVDMTGCPYLPSMALPPLLRLHETAQKEGKHVVVAVSPDLMDIFHTLRLETHLQIVASMEDARGMGNALLG